MLSQCELIYNIEARHGQRNHGQPSQDGVAGSNNEKTGGPKDRDEAYVEAEMDDIYRINVAKTEFREA